MSLDGIADFLFKRKIPSPKGRERWTQPVLGDLLSNQKYIGYIVSFDDFFLAHGEKSRRSNIDEDTHQRKATRYNSQSVLSGRLVCVECGRNYRRITRPSSEIVWRCANRVEHGKKSCQHSPSISEDRIKEVLCEKISFSNRGSFSEKKFTGIFIVSYLQGMKLQKSNSAESTIQNANFVVSWSKRVSPRGRDKEGYPYGQDQRSRKAGSSGILYCP